MLDSEGFVKAGWVHRLRLHEFDSADTQKFVIMGEVKNELSECNSHNFHD